MVPENFFFQIHPPIAKWARYIEDQSKWALYYLQNIIEYTNKCDDQDVARDARYIYSYLKSANWHIDIVLKGMKNLERWIISNLPAEKEKRDKISPNGAEKVKQIVKDLNKYSKITGALYLHCSDAHERIGDPLTGSKGDIALLFDEDLKLDHCRPSFSEFKNSFEYIKERIINLSGMSQETMLNKRILKIR